MTYNHAAGPLTTALQNNYEQLLHQFEACYRCFGGGQKGVVFDLPQFQRVIVAMEAMSVESLCHSNCLTAAAIDAKRQEGLDVWKPSNVTSGPTTAVPRGARPPKSVLATSAGEADIADEDAAFLNLRNSGHTAVHPADVARVFYLTTTGPVLASSAEFVLCCGLLGRRMVGGDAQDFEFAMSMQLKGVAGGGRSAKRASGMAGQGSATADGSLAAAVGTEDLVQQCTQGLLELSDYARLWLRKIVKTHADPPALALSNFSTDTEVARVLWTFSEAIEVMFSRHAISVASLDSQRQGQEAAKRLMEAITTGGGGGKSPGEKRARFASDVPNQPSMAYVMTRDSFHTFCTEFMLVPQHVAQSTSRGLFDAIVAAGADRATPEAKLRRGSSSVANPSGPTSVLENCIDLEQFMELLTHLAWAAAAEDKSDRFLTPQGKLQHLFTSIMAASYITVFDRPLPSSAGEVVPECVPQYCEPSIIELGGAARSSAFMMDKDKPDAFSDGNLTECCLHGEDFGALGRGAWLYDSVSGVVRHIPDGPKVTQNECLFTLDARGKDIDWHRCSLTVSKVPVLIPKAPMEDETLIAVTDGDSPTTSSKENRPRTFSSSSFCEVPGEKSHNHGGEETELVELPIPNQFQITLFHSVTLMLSKSAAELPFAKPVTGLVELKRKNDVIQLSSETCQRMDEVFQDGCSLVAYNHKGRLFQHCWEYVCAKYRLHEAVGPLYVKALCGPMAVERDAGSDPASSPSASPKSVGSNQSQSDFNATIGTLASTASPALTSLRMSKSIAGSDATTKRTGDGRSQSGKVAAAVKAPPVDPRQLALTSLFNLLAERNGAEIGGKLSLSREGFAEALVRLALTCDPSGSAETISALLLDIMDNVAIGVVPLGGRMGSTKAPSEAGYSSSRGGGYASRQQSVASSRIFGIKSASSSASQQGGGLQSGGGVSSRNAALRIASSEAHAITSLKQQNFLLKERIKKMQGSMEHMAQTRNEMLESLYQVRAMVDYTFVSAPDKGEGTMDAIGTSKVERLVREVMQQQLHKRPSIVQIDGAGSLESNSSFQMGARLGSAGPVRNNSLAFSAPDPRVSPPLSAGGPLSKDSSITALPSSTKEKDKSDLPPHLNANIQLQGVYKKHILTTCTNIINSISTSTELILIKKDTETEDIDEEVLMKESAVEIGESIAKKYGRDKATVAMDRYLDESMDPTKKAPDAPFIINSLQIRRDVEVLLMDNEKALRTRLTGSPGRGIGLKRPMGSIGLLATPSAASLSTEDTPPPTNAILPEPSLSPSSPTKRPSDVAESEAGVMAATVLGLKRKLEQSQKKIEADKKEATLNLQQRSQQLADQRNECNRLNIKMAGLQDKIERMETEKALLVSTIDQRREKGKGATARSKSPAPPQHQSEQSTHHLLPNASSSQQQQAERSRSTMVTPAPQTAATSPTPSSPITGNAPTIVEASSSAQQQRAAALNTSGKRLSFVITEAERLANEKAIADATVTTQKDRISILEAELTAANHRNAAQQSELDLLVKQKERAEGRVFEAKALVESLASTGSLVHREDSNKGSRRPSATSSNPSTPTTGKNSKTSSSSTSPSNAAATIVSRLQETLNSISSYPTLAESPDLYGNSYTAKKSVTFATTTLSGVSLAGVEDAKATSSPPATSSPVGLRPEGLNSALKKRPPTQPSSPASQRSLGLPTIEAEHFSNPPPPTQAGPVNAMALGPCVKCVATKASADKVYHAFQQVKSEYWALRIMLRGSLRWGPIQGGEVAIPPELIASPAHIVPILARETDDKGTSPAASLRSSILSPAMLVSHLPRGSLPSAVLLQSQRKESTGLHPQAPGAEEIIASTSTLHGKRPSTEPLGVVNGEVTVSHPNEAVARTSGGSMVSETMPLTSAQQASPAGQFSSARASSGVSIPQTAVAEEICLETSTKLNQPHPDQANVSFILSPIAERRPVASTTNATVEMRGDASGPITEGTHSVETSTAPTPKFVPTETQKAHQFGMSEPITQHDNSTRSRPTVATPVVIRGPANYASPTLPVLGKEAQSFKAMAAAAMAKAGPSVPLPAFGGAKATLPNPAAAPVIPSASPQLRDETFLTSVEVPPSQQQSTRVDGATSSPIQPSPLAASVQTTLPQSTAQPPRPPVVPHQQQQQPVGLSPSYVLASDAAVAAHAGSGSGRPVGANPPLSALDLYIASSRPHQSGDDRKDRRLRAASASASARDISTLFIGKDKEEEGATKPAYASIRATQHTHPTKGAGAGSASLRQRSAVATMKETFDPRIELFTQSVALNTGPRSKSPPTPDATAARRKAIEEAMAEGVLRMSNTLFRQPLISHHHSYRAPSETSSYQQGGSPTAAETSNDGLAIEYRVRLVDPATGSEIEMPRAEYARLLASALLDSAGGGIALQAPYAPSLSSFSPPREGATQNPFGILPSGISATNGTLGWAAKEAHRLLSYDAEEEALAAKLANKSPPRRGTLSAPAKSEKDHSAESEKDGAVTHMLANAPFRSVTAPQTTQPILTSRLDTHQGDYSTVVPTPSRMAEHHLKPEDVVETSKRPHILQPRKPSAGVAPRTATNFDKLRSAMGKR